VSTEKFVFRPRARLLQLLGDQLIGDPRAAVFELVKNAYDADSPSAAVRFISIDDPSQARILVEDTGEGMDLATIKEIWLEPGADHRELQRIKGQRSEKFHRLPIGEKGVGRFASHKLGRSIEMVTKREGHSEIIVRIDWDKLIEGHRYLSDAGIEIEERSPKIFKGGKTGTLITISGLRHKWTRGDIRRLYRSINSISSPYDRKHGFTVSFAMKPNKGWTDGLLSAEDAAELAMFFYEFTIAGETLTYKYEFRPFSAILNKARRQPAVGLQPRTVEKSIETLEYFTMEQNSEGKKTKRAIKADLTNFGIGPISGNIQAFDRDREILPLYPDQTGLVEFLDQNGGIRVYRDGIRVYNYGEPGNDWLGLDERRVQVPKRRLSNNIVLGEVRLQLESSTALVEKTNREGFVENTAQHEFRKAVLAAIIQFEKERSIDKDNLRALYEIPADAPDNFPVIKGPEQAISVLWDKVTERGWRKELSPYIERVESTYAEVRDTLLEAAGPGLGLSVVFHELDRGVRDLARAIDDNTDPGQVSSMARHLVELMQGASYFVRGASRKAFGAAELVHHAIFSISPRLQYHGIQITDGFVNSPEANFKIRGSRRMLIASLVNVLDNAIYWIKVSSGELGDAGKPRRIWIGPSGDANVNAILIADTGPGIEDGPEIIVRPFFSRKDDGMGMGLYFVNMTMQSHSGRLEFPSIGDYDIPAAYTGAIVAMIFGEKAR
jgi:signal transduction histidine kinase